MKTTIIGIAGGTGSGKSTFTNRLKDKFGDDITVVYHDNYYKAHDNMPFEERKKLNYDIPEAFDTDIMVEHIKALKEGKTIICPTYDFTVHNRAAETMTIKPSRVIIVEGILTLYDERLRDLFDIKIFVDADADERILRRVVRDTRERGRDLDNIIDQYLTTVKESHYLYCEPTRKFADMVLNSGLNETAFQIMSSYINDILTGDVD